MRITGFSRIALILGSVLALASACHAQCSSYGGSTYRSYTPTYSYRTYSAPTYKKEYVEKVYVSRFLAVLPLADFSSTYAFYYPPPTPPAYAPVAPAVAAAPAAAPYAGATAAAPHSACSAVGTELKAALLALARSQQEINAKFDRLLTPPVGPGPAPAPAGPPPMSAPAPAPAPPRKAPESPTAIDLVTVNKQSCAACHSRTNAGTHGGELVLSEDTGAVVKLTNEQLLAITRVISKGSMPKMNARAKAAGIKPLDEAVATAWIQEVNRQATENSKSKKTVEPDEVRYEVVVKREPARFRSLRLWK